MVKRLICAVVLLALCFSFCALSYFELDKMTTDLIDELEKASTYLKSENTEAAKKQIDAVLNKWEKDKAIMSIFLNHSHLENLSIDIPSIKPLSYKGNEDEAAEIAQRCINSLKEIMEEQKISLANIL